jgi:hypothetical protein
MLFILFEGIFDLWQLILNQALIQSCIGVLCEVVWESFDVICNLINYVGVGNDFFHEVFEPVTKLHVREEEDWVDGRLIAVLNDSHNADAVRHLHLSALGITSAWGVKYADYFLVVFDFDLLAVPSGWLSGSSTNYGFKSRDVPYSLRACLNVVIIVFNHFSASQ